MTYDEVIKLLHEKAKEEGRTAVLLDTEVIQGYEDPVITPLGLEMLALYLPPGVIIADYNEMHRRILGDLPGAPETPDKMFCSECDGPMTPVVNGEFALQYWSCENEGCGVGVKAWKRERAVWNAALSWAFDDHANRNIGHLTIEQVRALLPDHVTVVEHVCEVTKNPCGTDTWMEGTTCKCPGCQSWLIQNGFCADCGVKWGEPHHERCEKLPCPSPRDRPDAPVYWDAKRRLWAYQDTKWPVVQLDRKLEDKP